VVLVGRETRKEKAAWGEAILNQDVRLGKIKENIPESNWGGGRERRQGKKVGVPTLRIETLVEIFEVTD